MGSKRIVAAIVAVGMFGAVGSVNAQTSPTVAHQISGDAPQASVVLPVHLDRILRDYERLWEAGDEDGLAALFVEDGLIVRNGIWIRGRSSIRAAYVDASGPLRLRAVEFAADDALGFIIGAYGYGDERPVEDRGMFVLTLKHDAALGWLIVSDLDRSASE